MPATLVGLDLDTGLAVVRLKGAGPWAAATLIPSGDTAVGAVTGTVGLDEDGDLVHAASTLQAVRRFSAFWEYMLDRALVLSPSISSWGGSAAVDERGPRDRHRLAPARRAPAREPGHSGREAPGREGRAR